MEWAYLSAFLLVILVWREWCHDKERKDLYSRFMAKDLNDYKVNTAPATAPRATNFVKAGIKRGINELTGVGGE